MRVKVQGQRKGGCSLNDPKQSKNEWKGTKAKRRAKETAKISENNMKGNKMTWQARGKMKRRE